MGKSPEAFRTISEVSALLETPAHVLRFWEQKFPQVKPVKRAGGRRYYRPTDIALLNGIKALLHDQGVAIRGVQKLLTERGSRYVASLSPAPWASEGRLNGAAFDAEWDEEPDADEAGPHELGPAELGPDDMAPEAAEAGEAAPEDDGELEGEELGGAAPLPAPPPTSPPTSPPTPVAAPARATGTGPAARALALLAAADRDRLRGEAHRIAPLARRLLALRDRLAPLPPPGESL